MSINDDIHKQLFDKINAATNELALVRGQMEAQNKINGDLVRLLKLVLWGAFVIILILLGALIFGAIGKDGLFAVRDSMPKVAQAIPWHNDFDRKWRFA